MHRRTAGKLAHRIVLIIAVAVSLVTLSTPTVQADTPVGGPMISDTTWTLANSPYVVVESVEVWEGITLTIEPGVVVKFDPEKKLQVSGELIAQGTEGNLVTFTSNQPDPAPGDWGNIEFTTTALTTTMDSEGNYISGSILQYCVIEYGGCSVIDAHSLLIDHCDIRSNVGAVIARGEESAPSWVANSSVTGRLVVDWCLETDALRILGGNVTDSSVSGNMARGIYVHHGRVSRNTVADNSWQGIHAYADAIVSDNSVRNNSRTGIYARNTDTTITRNTVTGNDGDGIYSSRASVEGNTVTGNAGRGIESWMGSVVHNTVSGNGGPGIHCEFTNEVVSNVISGNSEGGLEIASGTVLSNTIVANSVSTAGGCAGACFSSGIFSSNTIVGNIGPSGSTAAGLRVSSSSSQVHYNNLYGNEPYDVTVVGSDDISGTNNYWGTVSTVDILSQVYDWYDDSERGKFLYVPYLQEPSEDAPLPPPTGLTADFQDDIAILSWDAHPSFTTGYGYKVYYDIDSSLPPYEGTGLNEGDAPIDVGDQTAYTLTGLDPSKDYWCAVTAYDNEGHESWYSNVVWKQGGYWLYLPVLLRQ